MKKVSYTDRQELEGGKNGPSEAVRHALMGMAAGG